MADPRPVKMDVRMIPCWPWRHDWTLWVDLVDNEERVRPLIALWKARLAARGRR
jgi:hypothetical protein